MHDMLTGLGNRALLWERLTGSLARARRTDRRVGVLITNRPADAVALRASLPLITPAASREP